MTSTHSPDWGVYVHVPWCAARCPYCAFTFKVTRTPIDERAYLDALLIGWETWRGEFPDGPSTLYFGGGTPSLLSTEALGSLVEMVVDSPNTEITVEMNPEDVTESKINGLVDAGVTRISLGVQTLNPAHAARIGRQRSSARAFDAAQVIRKSDIQSWSVDLMFALPGQRIQEVDQDLTSILAMEPDHIGLYGLTWEPGTAFARGLEKGNMKAVNDESWRKMYDLIVTRMHRSGRHRYEVSNFARPGHESRHNKIYWSDGRYLGIGPSAHGYAADGRRWMYSTDIDAWFDDPAGAMTIETPSPEQAAADLIISSLRGVNGLDLSYMFTRVGLRPAPAVVGALIRAGLVQQRGERIQLTANGFPMCDGVAGRLVDALVSAQ